MIIKFLCALFACLILSSCNFASNADLQEARKEINNLNQRLTTCLSNIDALTSSVGKKDDEIDALKKKVNKIEIDIHLLRNRSCDLNISGHGYCVLATDVGNMTVSCKEIAPYLDGSKLKIHLGNISSATLTRVGLNFEYGESPEGKKFDEWIGGVKKNKTTLMEDVLPGYWHEAEVVLRGVPPEKLGYLNVAIDVPGISLKNKTNRP